MRASLTAALIMLFMLTIEASAQGAHRVELDRDLLSPGDPLIARVFGACNVTLIGPNIKRVLFSGYRDYLELEIDTSGLPLGIYDLVNSCGDDMTKASFTLDELSMDVRSPSPNLVEVVVRSRLLNSPVGASIRVDGLAYDGPFSPSPGSHIVEANYSGLTASIEFEVPEILVGEYYTPSDEVSIMIRSEGRPELRVISPLNVSERLEVLRLNSTHWRASLGLRHAVALGRYDVLVSLGNLTFSRSFKVTYFILNHSMRDGLLNLSVRDALTGEPVRGTLELESCFWNGSFQINGSLLAGVSGPARLILRDERGLRFEATIPGASTDEGLYFPGENVSICASGWFRLRSPSGRVLLEGSVSGVRTLSYPLAREVELGTYSIESDGPPWRFSVDSYSIEASIEGSLLKGRVSYFFVEPKSVSYRFLPSNLTGEAEVRNGSFSLEVPPDQEAVMLECGNSAVELNVCASSLEVAGVRLEANGTCLTAEESDEGIILTMRSQEGFLTILRAEVPEDKEISVSPRAGGTGPRMRTMGRIQEIFLRDGSPSDPDGEANGLIRLVLSIREREKAQEGAQGMNLSAEFRGKGGKEAKLRLIREIVADGPEGRWRARFYEVNGSSVGLKGLSNLRRAKTVVEEERVGGGGGVRVSYEPLGEGRILVTVDGKEGGWVRVSIRLPRGAVVDDVIAEGGNGTRSLELWYQRGEELVFYDDPNQYYYVLYHVPPWWDPDGVSRGYDWHYRVPLQVPPMPKDHMIYLDVDFGYLLSLMNVTGTFDPNSVRVVDDGGSLVPRQEFIPLAPSRGRVRFILHKDLASATNFYIYFDITENGAKPYLNTLNSGLDSGTLDYWTYGRQPSGISSIIGASPPGPYTVYDPYGSPRYVTDDATPVFGSHSLVLGYRTSSGSEDETLTGEDTWAYYEFTVPADGGALEFWYRVEGWDSANFDYLNVTLRDTSNNVLATIISRYNPNPGNNYGPFKDSGWLHASYDLSSYAGLTVRVHFLVHTYWDDMYKTWAYVDNITWSKVDLTSYLNARMVEGFGVNVTSPKGTLGYGPLRVEARVDAKPSSVIARIYNPLGALVATAQLYDDGTNGDAVANDGIYTNANAYFLAPGSPMGMWRVVVLANDSSISTYSPSYNGLVHIPNRPYEVNYTDFFNVGESNFYLGYVEGVIFEDRYPLASHGPEDAPFSYVPVYAFKDNGDGTFDPLSDTLATWSRSDSSGRYRLALQGRNFLVVNSRALVPTLNSGHSSDETWADQTYGVKWNGSSYVGIAEFGGMDPWLSDACPMEVIFHDDFETWSGWNPYGSGGVTQSSAEFYNGSYSLQKYTGNDPDGGYKPLGRTIGRGYLLQGYAFRPISIGVRARVAVSLVDASYNGYGFIVDHRSNRIRVVRRTGGTFTPLNSVAYNPPEESWYFWKLILLENNTIIFRLYSTDGILLSEVRATDSAYNSFDRVLVQGDFTYYLDALVLWRLPSHCEHVAEVDTSNYLGESIDFGFSYEVVVNTKDSDDAPAELRFAQGSLRQFLMNSNAMKGLQRSYFRIPVSDPNHLVELVGSDPIDVWRIVLSSSLPVITDAVELDASTQQGRNASLEGPVVGLDSYRIPDFSTPRIEVDANGYDVFILNVTSPTARSKVRGFSLYNAPHAVLIRGNGNRVDVVDNFLGAYANGDSFLKTIFCVAIGEYAAPGAGDSNLSAVVRHNLMTNCSQYAVVVNSGNIANATIEDNWIRRSGYAYSVGDGVSLQTNGNAVRHNMIEDNGNNGDTSLLDGGAGLELVVWVPEQANGINEVINNTIRGNMRWGVSVLSTYTKALIRGNVIHNNGIGVIVGGTSVANITQNSVYNNTRVGIDLDVSNSPDGDDVTLNDGLINSGQPNWGMDYPIITSAVLAGGNLQVRGYIGAGDGSPAFSGARVDLYLVRNFTSGDNLVGNNRSASGTLPESYGEGYLYIGSLFADENGKFSGTLDVSGKGVECGSLLTGTSTLNGTSEFGPDARVICGWNVSARVRASGNEVKLSVTAREIDHRNVFLYWRCPENLSVVGMSGDYDENGQNGDVYWWRFNELRAGETKWVNITLSFSGDYSLLEAFNVGLDPPEGLSVEVTEFSAITFYPDGSHKVSRLWGFLTVRNQSPDPIYNLELHLDAPGYVFYLDYPAVSGEPDSPPLNYSYLAPFGYVRWRYEAPASEASVPLEVRERNLSCGVEITLTSREELREVRVRKLGEVWEVGDLRGGEVRRREFTAPGRGCFQESASLEFRYPNASLLPKLRDLRGVSSAEVSVQKELSGNIASFRAVFVNRASSLLYNLTRICLMRSPSGPIVACESPNVLLGPGEAYETAYFSEVVESVPKYYANASFTIVPSVSGSTVPLQSLASGLHLATASLPETVCCAPPAAAPTVGPTATTAELILTTTQTKPGPPAVTIATAETRTETVRTETATATKTQAVTTAPSTQIPVNLTIPPEVSRMPLPFIMSLGLPMLVALLMMRRRTGLVVLDYRTLKLLHDEGKLENLARSFRVAITDITLMRAFSDETLLRSIISLGPEVHVVESADLNLLLGMAPPGLDLDTLLARQLARRLGVEFLPDLLLGR